VDLGLEGKVALVTAASKGIGRATAQRFLREGARVAINSHNAAQLAAARDGMPAGSADRVRAYPADLLDAEATQRLYDAVLADHGRLDVLVMNTPGPRLLPVIETTIEDWNTAYNTLLRPAVQLAVSAARDMAAQGGGSIVFVTSTWVKQPMAGGILSASMRSAISAMAKQMAMELAPRQVRVNQVMPGATGTDRMKQILGVKAKANGTTEAQEAAAAASNLPLGRWGEPEEIADAIVFLCSPRSGFTTGAALQVDGGSIKSIL
jgi:3-oxoacyl-[acyl-carrier protein] reductase